MTELKNNHIGAFQGHRIETITLEREVYWLAAVFAASSTLHRLAPDEDDNELDKLRLHFEISEASRLLISVAVMLRNLMDAQSSEMLELSIRKMDMIVGHYTIGKKRRKKDLTFREACNKLIHALHINFDMAGMNKKKLCYLRPKVYLYGDFRDEDWRAVVDVTKFIKIAYRLS
ncbi:MAG: hypothetical protein CEE38_02760 [Planctomycetes bacterium B3_Pla]|nr:MAG: hypothetical protein CEE38_02760 [Planctomycetes bacterium B3_Pla]